MRCFMKLVDVVRRGVDKERGRGAPACVRDVEKAGPRGARGWANCGRRCPHAGRDIHRHRHLSTETAGLSTWITSSGGGGAPWRPVAPAGGRLRLLAEQGRALG